MKSKLKWKTIIITFLITGFLTTIIAGSITAAATWYITKNKYEDINKSQIERLERQLDDLKNRNSEF